MRDITTAKKGTLAATPSAPRPSAVRSTRAVNGPLPSAQGPLSNKAVRLGFRVWGSGYRIHGRTKATHHNQTA